MNKRTKKTASKTVNSPITALVPSPSEPTPISATPKTGAGLAGAMDLHEQINVLFFQRFGQTLDEFLDVQSLTSTHEVIQSLPSLVAIAVLERLIARMETSSSAYASNIPDAAHNLAMHANRLDRNDLAFRLIKVCCDSIFPQNVDLLADLLQELYTHHWNLDEAGKTWTKLQAIPSEIRSKYWRYWVYGATYHWEMKHDLEIAKQLLEEGVGKVQSDGKAHVYERLVTVHTDWSSDVTVVSIRQLIKRLEDGIKCGYENSHILATKLAVLERRLAGQDTGENMGDACRKHLERVRGWLDLAEAIFTEDPHHRITDIYEERVNVLMGLDRYREAIEYISAIVNCAERTGPVSPSLKAQLIVACYEDGQPELWRELLNERPQSVAPPAPSN